MHIYPWQIAPLQSSIDALHSTTPGDLTQRTSTYGRPFTHEGNYLVAWLMQMTSYVAHMYKFIPYMHDKYLAYMPNSVVIFVSNTCSIMLEIIISCKC